MDNEIFEKKIICGSVKKIVVPCYLYYYLFIIIFKKMHSFSFPVAYTHKS